MTISIYKYPKNSFSLSILHELEQFGLYSNFKVNVTKSRCLNITLPLTEKGILETNFPFQWQLHSLKYLGVNIASTEEKIYELNYLPMLNSVINQLQLRIRGKTFLVRENGDIKNEVKYPFLYIYIKHYL